MKKRAFVVIVGLVCAGWTVQAVAQSIVTDGNIETDAQLVSNVATGVAPLAVSSTTMVPSLNADQVDGMEAAAFAQDADLQTAEAMLVALQAQVDALTPQLIGPALVPATGQATMFVTGDDGDLERGIVWLNPRFTKNGDGTVTDNLTGLIWLEDANCANAPMDWPTALAFANTLFDGSVSHNSGDCGLSDTSAAGAWRLPNVRELQSLVHWGVFNPALPNTVGTGQWVEGDPFSGVVSNYYWSSTTFAGITQYAWRVYFGSGTVNANLGKSTLFFVWPVRGGQ